MLGEPTSAGSGVLALLVRVGLVGDLCVVWSALGGGRARGKRTLIPLQAVPPKMTTMLSRPNELKRGCFLLVSGEQATSRVVPRIGDGAAPAGPARRLQVRKGAGRGSATG